MAKGAQRLARWFLWLQVLPQFHYAEELLQEKEEKGRGVSRLARWEAYQKEGVGVYRCLFDTYKLQSRQ